MSEVIINVFLEDNSITIRMENDCPTADKTINNDFSEINIDSVRHSFRLLLSRRP